MKSVIIETTNRANKQRDPRVWKTHWVLKVEEGFARDTLDESEELTHFKINPVSQLTGNGPLPRISELWGSREYSGLVSFLQKHGVHIEGKDNRQLVGNLLVGCPGRVYKVETQKRCRFLYKKADEDDILQHVLRRYQELSLQEAV